MTTEEGSRQARLELERFDCNCQHKVRTTDETVTLPAIINPKGLSHGMQDRLVLSGWLQEAKLRLKGKVTDRQISAQWEKALLELSKVPTEGLGRRSTSI